MKRMILAAAVLALSGCMSMPVTQTAFNDDACLRQSVRASVESPPITPRQRAAPTKCKNMGGSWSGVGAPENRSFQPDSPRN
jgi:hypothetical protein